MGNLARHCETLVEDIPPIKRSLPNPSLGPFHQSIPAILVCRLRNNLLCPVQAIVNCMQLSLGASPVGPALTYRTNHRLKPLTYDRFVARVCQCLSACSLPASQFASHSFHRGGASHCYAIGLSSESIKGCLDGMI